MLLKSFNTMELLGNDIKILIIGDREFCKKFLIEKLKVQNVSFSFCWPCHFPTSFRVLRRQDMFQFLEIFQKSSFYQGDLRLITLFRTFKPTYCSNFSQCPGTFIFLSKPHNIRIVRIDLFCLIC